MADPTTQPDPNTPPAQPAPGLEGQTAQPVQATAPVNNQATPASLNSFGDQFIEYQKHLKAAKSIMMLGNIMAMTGNDEMANPIINIGKAMVGQDPFTAKKEAADLFDKFTAAHMDKTGLIQHLVAAGIFSPDEAKILKKAKLTRDYVGADGATHRVTSDTTSDDSNTEYSDTIVKYPESATGKNDITGKETRTLFDPVTGKPTSSANVPGARNLTIGDRERIAAAGRAITNVNQDKTAERKQLADEKKSAESIQKEYLQSYAAVNTATTAKNNSDKAAKVIIARQNRARATEANMNYYIHAKLPIPLWLKKQVKMDQER